MRQLLRITKGIQKQKYTYKIRLPAAKNTYITKIIQTFRMIQDKNVITLRKLSLGS